MPTYTKRRRLLTDEEIIARYELTRDSEAVAFHAGVSAATVLNVVRQAGRGELIPLRGKGSKGHFREVGLSQEEIVARYRNGATGPELAVAANCSLYSIYTALKRANTPRRPSASVSKRTKPRQEKGREDG